MNDKDIVIDIYQRLNKIGYVSTELWYRVRREYLQRSGLGTKEVVEIKELKNIVYSFYNNNDDYDE